MKKVLAFAAAISMISGSAFAIGAVDLTTYDAAGGAGLPIYYLTSGSLPSGGSDFYAQVLYNGTPIVSTTGTSTFAIASDGNFDGGYGDIPGTTDSQANVSLTLRAWKGASWATATATGELTWNQTIGTDPGAPTTPSGLNLNIPSSLVLTPVVTTPEPTTIALGMLGAAALLIRRRK
jgi:hypothetical protein